MSSYARKQSEDIKVYQPSVFVPRVYIRLKGFHSDCTPFHLMEYFPVLFNTKDKPFRVFGYGRGNKKWKSKN